jgi:hypothetical protein
VFVVIVVVIIGLSGKGGSALNSYADLLVSDTFEHEYTRCSHDAVVVYTV